MTAPTRSDAAWLAGQGLLFATAFLGVPATGGAPGRVELEVPTAVEVAVAALGVGVALWAMAALGRLLVPQPTPVSDGRVVEAGPYGLVRHPIYTGVVLLVLAVALRYPGLGSALVVVAAVVFLDAKSRHEERLLRAAHAGYQHYRERVRWRLLPGLL